MKDFMHRFMNLNIKNETLRAKQCNIYKFFFMNPKLQKHKMAFIKNQI